MQIVGDVDFKQSYFTCGVQLTLYSFLSLFSYSKGVKPLNMTSNVLQKLFPHIDSPFEVKKSNIAICIQSYRHLHQH